MINPEPAIKPLIDEVEKLEIQIQAQKSCMKSWSKQATELEAEFYKKRDGLGRSISEANDEITQCEMSIKKIRRAIDLIRNHP